MAFEKLKVLKVGELYIERQEGKLRTVLELVRYRMEHGRIDGVLWLCTGRKAGMLREGIERHAADIAPDIILQGMESLSHRLKLFCELMRKAEEKRLMLVIDNGLLIKNMNALRTQRVLALSEKCPYRLLISDVPFTQSVADMYAQWRALDWRILGYVSYWGFAINHLGQNKQGRNTDYLIRAIEPYCAQLLRKEVQKTGGREEFVWRFLITGAARQEYEDVAERFMYKALYSRTGMYRMLQACQAVTSGRRILQDYPLITINQYSTPEENPRIQALLEVIDAFKGKQTLILCRYRLEYTEICAALEKRYGADAVSCYPKDDCPTVPTQFTVMNVLADERESARLQAEVMVYYNCDWNWHKRSEKEKQCMSALSGKKLTVVSLAAADTIDLKVLRCVWQKDNMVRCLQKDIQQKIRRKAGEK